MTDPAVAAAQRAQDANDDWPWDTTGDAMLEAAREALKPIQKLVECCEEFGDELDIDDLKKLIYPTEGR